MPDTIGTEDADGTWITEFQDSHEPPGQAWLRLVVRRMESLGQLGRINTQPRRQLEQVVQVQVASALLDLPPDSTRALSDLTATSALSHSVGEPANAAERITVVLGRFDALLGHGLTQMLQEDPSLRIIGADLDRPALEHTVAEQAPRVAILDETTVIESSTLERLRAAQSAIGIIVLAHLPTIAYGMRLFAGGASCVAKEAPAADILVAVHIAADGRRVFVADDGHLVERSTPVAAGLTPREVEVLEYLSRGRSHTEIANALRLSVETVRTHSAHIRRKLGVRNKRELIGLPIRVEDGRGPREDDGTRPGDVT